MVIELFETWPGKPVGEYDTEHKVLHLFRKTTEMVYGDVDWIVIVPYPFGLIQINPLRHAPTPEEQKVWITNE